MVFHQAPCSVGKSGHVHQPDIYICCANGNLPGKPVLVSDIKISDSEKSIMESTCYALGAISTVCQTKYPVVLSLPIFYETTYLLRVCFAINGKICEVKIAQCNLSNEDESRKFLAKLYIAVRYLLKNEVFNRNAPLPFKSLIDQCITILSSNGKVFLIGNKVHKLLSAADYAIPNIEGRVSIERCNLVLSR